MPHYTWTETKINNTEEWRDYVPNTEVPVIEPEPWSAFVNFIENLINYTTWELEEIDFDYTETEIIYDPWEV